MAALVMVAGCAQAAPVVAPVAAPVARALEVRGTGAPFTFADGAAARRQADAVCGGAVRTSIYDRFDDATGAWVFVEGCA